MYMSSLTGDMAVKSQETLIVTWAAASTESIYFFPIVPSTPVLTLTEW